MIKRQRLVGHGPERYPDQSGRKSGRQETWCTASVWCTLGAQAVHAGCSSRRAAEQALRITDDSKVERPQQLTALRGVRETLERNPGRRFPASPFGRSAAPQAAHCQRLAGPRPLCAPSASRFCPGSAPPRWRGPRAHGRQLQGDLPAAGTAAHNGDAASCQPLGRDDGRLSAVTFTCIHSGWSSCGNTMVSTGSPASPGPQKDDDKGLKPPGRVLSEAFPIHP